MARQRSYRHDMKCPYCGSNWLPKDGRSRGKQTYRCGDCRYRFTPDGNRSFHSQATIRRALDMYLECSSLSAVSRVMGVPLTTVHSWVKKSPLGEDGGGGETQGALSPRSENDSRDSAYSGNTYEGAACAEDLVR